MECRCKRKMYVTQDNGNFQWECECGLVVTIRGVKQCPVCSMPIYESVGTDCNDYYRCDKCRLSIRIFHRPIRRTSEKSFDGVGIA